MADQASFSPQAQYDGTGHIALKTLTNNTEDLLTQLLLEAQGARKAAIHLATQNGLAAETDFYTEQQEIS
jgi:hypothetical protein